MSEASSMGLVETIREQQAEIERLTAAFTELTDALNKVLPGNSPSEWMKEIERLQRDNEGLRNTIKLQAEGKHADVMGMEEIERLRAALDGLLKRYVDLVNCGDCGFWDPEKEDEVIAAREALRDE